jgi:hypothetical protein
MFAVELKCASSIPVAKFDPPPAKADREVDSVLDALDVPVEADVSVALGSCCEVPIPLV